MKYRLNAIATAFVITMVNLSPTSASEARGQAYPDVLEVKVQTAGPGRFDFDVTISSPYDTPQRYADAFRVMSTGGISFGERTLFHDHASEQPFTRDLYGVRIPAGVRTVIVQARDRKNGYGGKTRYVNLPTR